MKNCEPSLNQRIQTYWQQRGRINLLNPLASAENFERTLDENRRNQQAENAYARQNLWGSSSGPASDHRDEEMRQTVLGDYQQTVHQHYPQAASSSWGKSLLGLGLMAAGIGGPVTGYLIGEFLRPKTPTIKETPAAPDPDTDTTIQLTLPDWPVTTGELDTKN